MHVYLRAKFEVSSVVLTYFRRGTPQNEPLKSPRRLGLTLSLQLEKLFKFAMIDRLLMKHGFGKSLPATPTKRLQKMHWPRFTKITFTNISWHILILIPL